MDNLLRVVHFFRHSKQGLHWMENLRRYIEQNSQEITNYAGNGRISYSIRTFDNKTI